IGAFMFGLIVDLFLPKGFFQVSSHIMNHEHREFIPFWLQLGAAIILALLIVFTLIKRYFISGIKSNMETQKIKVSGMTCNHCRMNVEKAVMSIEGVSSVTVDLSTGIVNYTAEKIISEEQIKTVIEAIGYKVDK
ncbi:MAG: cation transporter, partial [Bacteroidota bacterium]